MIDGSRIFPRSVLQTDTIIVSYGLANFERVSWSMQRCHKIWELCGEPATMADYDKFLESFEDDYPGACDDRSVWMIDYEKFDDSDRDKNLKIHADRNSRIMKSFLGFKDYCEQHRHCMWEYHNSSSVKNVLTMICKSGCHRSAANAESWSNMLTRCGRLLHSVPLLHSPELVFLKNTRAGKCSECGQQSAKIYQKHHSCVRAECSRLVSASDSTTEYWKQLRRESLGRRHEGSKSLRSTGITTTPGRVEYETEYLQRLGGAPPKFPRKRSKCWPTACLSAISLVKRTRTRLRQPNICTTNC